MKQKLLFIAVLVMAMAIPQSVKAYHFSYTYQGQTLYYLIVNGEAQVTYPNSSGENYSNLSDTLIIPSYVIYNGTTLPVTSIGDYAFNGCSGLTSVTIPNSVTSIGQSAFYGCSGLTSVTIPNSITSIGNGAFRYCNGLTSLTIPNSVTSIGNGAFNGCSGLISVTIGNSVTSIGDYAFNSCSGLTSVTIGNSVTSIGDYAFNSCSGLTSVTIPNSVTSIGSHAFSDCSVLSSIIVENGNMVYDSRENCNAIIKTASNTLHIGCMNSTIPNSVTSIGNYAFYDCSGLTSVTIPNSITSIGQSAFYGCVNLTSVTIGNFVTSFGNTAFAHCSGLTSITIPNSVTSIGQEAFSNCSNLDTVYMESMSAPTIGSWCFNHNRSERVFITPCGSYYSYYYASSWSSYRSALRNNVIILINVLPNDSLLGTIEVIPQQGSDVSCDSTAIIRATANYGYHFDHWSNGSISNPDTLILTGDSNLTAFFLPNQYTITLISSDESLGSVSGAGTYQYLDTVELVATAIEHYHSVRWTWHNDEYPWYDDEGSFDNPLHFVVRYDATITAYFAIDTHMVSVTSNDIARGMVESTGTEFEYGTPCTVMATAYTGYTFAGWSNGVTANPYTFAVLSDVELTALFIAEGEEVYTVTVVSADPSMGSVSGGGQAMSGGEVAIRAISNPGYHFLRWNDNNTDSVRTVTVTANATYTAFFEANNVGIVDAHAINAKVYSTHGQIVVEGANGDMVTLYDITGRVLVSKQDEYAPLRFDAPASGTYMIKIGNYPARKVVVIR